MRSILLLALLTFLPLAGSTSCAKAPPNLTPQAQQAFWKTEVLKSLDFLRDFAIDGEATSPQVFSTAVTRDVVETHRSLVGVMRAADSGWQSAVSTALDELLSRRSDSDKRKFGPYVSLVKVALQEIH